MAPRRYVTPRYVFAYAADMAPRFDLRAYVTPRRRRQQRVYESIIKYVGETECNTGG